MKKDIVFPVVEGLKVAIAKRLNNVGETEWNAYIINNRNELITNVLVSTKGYGEINGEAVKTSVLRHMVGDLAPQEYAIIEMIDPSVFKLSNEFWISFYVGNTIYDKKFIFLAESIIESNLIKIPELGLMGVLHK